MTNGEKKTTKGRLRAAAAACIAVPALLIACAAPAAYAMAGGTTGTVTDEDGTTTSAQTAGAAAGTTDDAQTAAAGGGALADRNLDVDAGNGNAARPAVDGDDPDTPDPVAGPVPNIIITNFTYGDGSVAAGSDFTLSFTFQNMGKVAVDNLVVTVDGGESFAIAGGTNTFYFDSLGAGWAMTQSVPMQALSTATSGAQGVTVSFKYEYVDAGSRSSSSSDIKISVPVSQPDRFELKDPVQPDMPMVGQETTVTMEYVNKGKGGISNVEASIEGDGVDTTMRTQYVGNVASGATGAIGFAFTPLSTDPTDVTLRITYEDSDGKTQTKEFPITIQAQEASVDPGFDDNIVVPDDTEQTGVAWWVWAIVAVVAIAAVVLIVTLVRRRRKAKQAKEDDEDWADWAVPTAGTAAAAGAAGPAAADVPSGAGETTQPIVGLPSAGDEGRA
ncbi:ABC transporter permease [Bifidobacterium samirii]|uniref:ABC transporter permease n=1 Tax=Bifidobacterium samirii TaxID=2306974 RepID=A0A430FW25_9BIFI|nr:ABC transporter permease [Bifidobacterium samirii]RSX58132.1 ABC transporter permease [Bifidobacterium samirii]